MALASGAHVDLGGVEFRLDENAPLILNKAAYRHWSRSLFTQRLDITGKPGAQNLNPDEMRWYLTQFDGEGQVVLNDDDPVLANRFYRSEGLDFRIPGQMKLNRSTILQSPQDATGGASATSEGSAWSDVSGTSTTSGTDRRLSAVTNIIKSATHTPGAGKVEPTFHLYKEDVQKTTDEGSTWTIVSGSGTTSDTDFRLKDGILRSPNLAGLTAGVTVQVDVTYSTTGSGHGGIYVYNKTNERVVTLVEITSGTTSRTDSLTFNPISGKTYQVRARWESGAGNRLVLDKDEYYNAPQPTTVTVSVYNETGASTVVTKQVIITNTASAGVVSLTYTAAAATNYTYRVQYDAGPQRPWVDKSVAVVRSTSAWTMGALELGQGGNIWLVGFRSGVDSQTWTYDFTNDDWDVRADLTGATNRDCYALAHTDAYQYALMADAKVYQFTTAADDDYTAAITGTPVGMCITQDRLFVLCEDSTNGVIVRTFAVDADVSGGVTAEVTNKAVSTAKNTADTTLRQRMVGTRSGAQFFVNYSDVTCRIYEADTSSGSLVISELGSLDIGAKGTAISHVGGLTFIVGQFLAETGKTARSALWVLDQNNVPQRIGYLRRDDPDARAPQYLVPYESDMWILQGNLVWRYSLQSGGLFLEYQLDQTTPANQRALGVVAAHQFAVNSTEGVFVTGSLSTYRQAGVANANQFVSSLYDFGLPGTLKLLSTLQVLTDDMPANAAVRVEYQLDQDGTWHHAGTVTDGKINTLTISSEDSSATFGSIQIRLTLSSGTGANTPTVRAIIVTAFPTKYEEFFDLVIRADDEDSSDRVADVQRTGGELAAHIRGIWQGGNLTTFVDGYESLAVGSVNTYLVRVDDYDQSFDAQGQGRVSIRLRVIAA